MFTTSKCTTRVMHTTGARVLWVHTVAREPVSSDRQVRELTPLPPFRPPALPPFAPDVITRQPRHSTRRGCRRRRRRQSASSRCSPSRRATSRAARPTSSVWWRAPRPVWPQHPRPGSCAGYRIPLLPPQVTQRSRYRRGKGSSFKSSPQASAGGEGLE